MRSNTLPVADRTLVVTPTENSTHTHTHTNEFLAATRQEARPTTCWCQIRHSLRRCPIGGVPQIEAGVHGANRTPPIPLGPAEMDVDTMDRNSGDARQHSRGPVICHWVGPVHPKKRHPIDDDDDDEKKRRSLRFSEKKCIYGFYHHHHYACYVKGRVRSAMRCRFASTFSRTTGRRGRSSTCRFRFFPCCFSTTMVSV